MPDCLPVFDEMGCQRVTLGEHQNRPVPAPFPRCFGRGGDVALTARHSSTVDAISPRGTSTSAGQIALLVPVSLCWPRQRAGPLYLACMPRQPATLPRFFFLFPRLEEMRGTAKWRLARRRGIEIVPLCAARS